MSMMVDYVRKMTVKKSCKRDEYGSFERLLFLSDYIDIDYSICFVVIFDLGSRSHWVKNNSISVSFCKIRYSNLSDYF